MCWSRIYESFSKKTFIFISITILVSWNGKNVFCDREHLLPGIHRVWPSLRVPDAVSTTASSNITEEEPKRNESMTSIPPPDSEPATSSTRSKKTVVFPSPICISLPMAPCFMFQVFWRNSSSSVLGLRVPTNRIPSFPRPRELQLSKSQGFK